MLIRCVSTYYYYILVQDHAVRTLRALLAIPLFLLAFHDLKPVTGRDAAAISWGWVTVIKVWNYTIASEDCTPFHSILKQLPRFVPRCVKCRQWMVTVNILLRPSVAAFTLSTCILIHELFAKQMLLGLLILIRANLIIISFTIDFVAGADMYSHRFQCQRHQDPNGQAARLPIPPPSSLWQDAGCTRQGQLSTLTSTASDCHFLLWVTAWKDAVLQSQVQYWLTLLCSI